MNYYMYLYIFFKNGKVEKHMIKRFSDLSQDKSMFYYYEELNDEHGKVKTFFREDVSCFELSPCELVNWEQLLCQK